MLLKKILEEKCVPRRKLLKSSLRAFREVPPGVIDDLCGELLMEGKIFKRINAWGRKFYVVEELISELPLPCDDGGGNQNPSKWIFGDEEDPFK